MWESLKESRGDDILADSCMDDTVEFLNLLLEENGLILRSEKFWLHGKEFPVDFQPSET